MACEGVYADVQLGEDGLTDEIEEPSVRRAEETENKAEEVDKEKFLWMLKMYKEFKTEYVRILRFDSSASVAPFGKNSSLVFFTFLKSNILEEELPASTVEVVQIFFDSSTFDDIERDKKVKLDVQISLIIRFV